MEAGKTSHYLNFLLGLAPCILIFERLVALFLSDLFLEEKKILVQFSEDVTKGKSN